MQMPPGSRRIFLFLFLFLRFVSYYHPALLRGLLCLPSRYSESFLSFNRSGYTAILAYGSMMLLIASAVTHWRIKDASANKD
jgi:hypothetical protein